MTLFSHQLIYMSIEKFSVSYFFSIRLWVSLIFKNKLCGVMFRIKQIRKLQGMKQKDLAETTGLSNPYLSALETGRVKKSPSLDTLQKIAASLDVRIGDLFDDAKPVPINGSVGAADKVSFFPEDDAQGLRKIKCPAALPPAPNLMGIEVEGDSLMPAYADGDILFYEGQQSGVSDDAVGRVCLCQDAEGEQWVKFVKSGTEPGHFHLLSLNPLSDNIMNVELDWAYPVILHWPGRMVEDFAD